MGACSAQYQSAAIFKKRTTEFLPFHVKKKYCHRMTINKLKAKLSIYAEKNIDQCSEKAFIKNF